MLLRIGSFNSLTFFDFFSPTVSLPLSYRFCIIGIGIMFLTHIAGGSAKDTREKKLLYTQTRNMCI